MSPFKKALNQRSPFRRDLRPAVESLEGRLAMSTTPTVAALGLPVVGDDFRPGHEQRKRALPQARRGQPDQCGRQGRARARLTNAAGKYAFNVRNNGAYVVHVNAPSGFVQTTPTFSNEKPTGAASVPAPRAARGRIRAPTRTPRTARLTPTPGTPSRRPGPALPVARSTSPTPAVNLSGCLSINYNDAVPKQIINNGHQFQVQFPATSTADTINVNGVTFTLAQFHYHSPSETLIHGRTYPMEEHFVNTSSTGGETVLAVFLKIGARNNALDPILNAAAANLAHDQLDDARHGPDQLRRPAADQHARLVLPGFA